MANDREVVHNGKHNTHSFMFQGRKITLLPAPEPDYVINKEQSTSKESQLVVSKAQFESELRDDCPLYALVATLIRHHFIRRPFLLHSPPYLTSSRTFSHRNYR